MAKMRIPVLIVDDEYLIRSLVRNSIDWDELGFEIVGEAEDGEAAFNMVETLRPLLMIVDINIPFVNGVELAKKVRLKYPQIKVIILTGYEDFHYARAAIHAGVLAYNLKPIDPEEFRETVIEARDTILIEERYRLLSIQNQVASQPDTSSLKSRFLLTLLNGKHGGSPKAIQDRWELFRIPLHPGGFVVSVIVAATAVPAEDLPEVPSMELLIDETGRIILISNDDPKTSRIKDKSYYEVAKTLISALNSRGIDIIAGISTLVPEIADLPEAYRQALNASERCYHEGRNIIHVHSFMDESRQSWVDLPSFSSREDLLLLLRSGQKQKAVDLVRSYLLSIKEKKYPREYCETACMEIISIINEFMEENSLSLKAYLNGADDVFALFLRFTTFDDLMFWLVNMLSQLLSGRDSGKTSKTQLVVRKAKLFIERNYTRKFITLERIAESVSVSPSYLSSVFKKELGFSVIEFLTDYRLRAAKGLMDKEPLEPIMEIAERVGYSDPYYFSKCFRKQFGVSPSDYLRSKKIIS